MVWRWHAAAEGRRRCKSRYLWPSRRARVRSRNEKLTGKFPTCITPFQTWLNFAYSGPVVLHWPRKHAVSDKRSSRSYERCVIERNARQMCRNLPCLQHRRSDTSELDLGSIRKTTSCRWSQYANATPAGANSEHHDSPDAGRYEPARHAGTAGADIHANNAATTECHAFAD